MAKQTNEQRALVARVRTTQLALFTTLVESGDHRGAERALVSIADQVGGKEGDKALALTLASIPPVNLAQILVATATQPSAIVGDLVSPKVFVNALTEVTKTWGASSAKDANHQLEELFIGVVMRPDVEGRYGREAKSFFRAILATGGQSIQLLAWWLASHGYLQEEGAETALIEKIGEALDDQDGSWMHLVGLLREHALHEHVVQQIKVTFESLLPSVAAAVEEGSSQSFLGLYCHKLGRVRTTLRSRY